jgi:hypothetical protein
MCVQYQHQLVTTPQRRTFNALVVVIIVITSVKTPVIAVVLGTANTVVGAVGKRVAFLCAR